MIFQRNLNSIKNGGESTRLIHVFYSLVKFTGYITKLGLSATLELESANKHNIPYHHNEKFALRPTPLNFL